VFECLNDMTGMLAGRQTWVAEGRASNPDKGPAMARLTRARRRR
jgi:hypothetical protein